MPLLFLWVAVVGCNLSDPLVDDPETGVRQDTTLPTDDTARADGARDAKVDPLDTADGGSTGSDTVENSGDADSGPSRLDAEGDTELEDTATDTSADTGGNVDGGPLDTGVVDSGLADTVGTDGGPADTGLVDTGLADTGIVDASGDTGLRDSGSADASDSGTGDTSDTGSDTGGSDTCTPTTEVCDGIDNDCDGTVDEGTDTVVLAEDFEGSDPLGWSEEPSNHPRLTIDDDATQGNPPQGSEYGRASYRTGTCEAVAGMAASKSIGEVDRITLQLNVDIDAWGRAALFVRDSAGNTTTIWSADAKGNGFTTNGWKSMTFDHSTSSKTTKSSGAVVEINPIPAGLGNETVTFIFGNNDDSSPCMNFDHGWVTRVDDVEVFDVCN